MYTHGSYLQLIGIGSGNGLVLNKWQAMNQ